MVNRILNIILFAMLFFVSACTAINKPENPIPNTGENAPAASMGTFQSGTYKQGDLIVFAAASLSGAFQEIGKTFEAAHPGVQVTFNFAGSQILRTQLEQGAQADVFASADHKNMDVLAADKLLVDQGYQDFATNQLIVILPKENPGGIQSLSDLSRPGIKLVLADASVPAGNYARQVLEKLSSDPAYGADFSQKVMVNVVSNETDVKQVVTKVELGEGDAGIVYLTDAIASPELLTIAIPNQFNIIAHYPIAVLLHAPNPDLAQAFVEFVRSPSGQEILSKWGFGDGSK